MTGPRSGSRTASRVPTLETLFVAALALCGLRLGLRPIGDNSFFTHLRTGIDIVAGRGIPRHDPYSFSAAGTAWTVQSWLPSTLYGLLERAGGGEALVLAHGLVYGVLAWMIATLARAGSALRTAAAGLVSCGIGAAYWSPRPLAVGLLCLGAVVLTVERRGRAWPLAIIGWIWVNSHGSFALGGLWLALVVLGPRRQPRYLVAFAGGCLLGGLNPLGPRLLWFPLVLVDKRDNFRRVLEWRPPSTGGVLVDLSLACLALAVVILAWALVRRRLPANELLAPAVFVVAAVASQRNLAPAAIVVAPALGRALRPSLEQPKERPQAHLGLAAAMGALAAVFLAGAAQATPFDLSGYPPPAALRAAQAGQRLATTDVAGGYLILREGRGADVFIDDRYDMYPERIVRDYLELLDGHPTWRAVLDRHGIDTVMWPRREELAAEMGRSPSWRRAFADKEWVVYVRAAGAGERH